MAVLYKNGEEVCRFYGVHDDGRIGRTQYSIRSNGVILHKPRFCDWRRWGQKKADKPLDEWIAEWRAKYAAMPAERRIFPKEMENEQGQTQAAGSAA